MTRDRLALDAFEVRVERNGLPERSRGRGGVLQMKTDANPMQRAPRCNAHSKRTGLPCRAPAVSGLTVCRMHGAGGGAPSGRRNGAWRHGDRTKSAEAMRSQLAKLVRESRELLKQI